MAQPTNVMTHVIAWSFLITKPVPCVDSILSLSVLGTSSILTGSHIIVHWLRLAVEGYLCADPCICGWTLSLWLVNEWWGLEGGRAAGAESEAWPPPTPRLLEGGEYLTGAAADPLPVGAVHRLPCGIWSKDVLY